MVLNIRAYDTKFTVITNERRHTTGQILNLKNREDSL